MRGGISFDGVGYRGATFKAGTAIKALVATSGRNAVVGLPVEISAAETVDLGTDGNTVFGFIESYELDGLCTVQFSGFRTGVPTVDTAPTVGKIVALDGAGKVKDSSTTAKLRNPIFVAVDTTAKTATVFLG